MRWLLLIATLAIVGGVGCGGSDDGGSASRSAAPVVTSKKQYIAQADAACNDFNQRVRAIPAAKSAKDVARLYREIAAEAQAFYDKFQAIPKPPRGEQILIRYQRNLANSVTITKQVADAFEKKNQGKVRDLYGAARKLQREDRSIAERYGFRVCGGVRK